MNLLKKKWNWRFSAALLLSCVLPLAAESPQKIERGQTLELVENSLGKVGFEFVGSMYSLMLEDGQFLRMVKLDDFVNVGIRFDKSSKLVVDMHLYVDDPAQRRRGYVVSKKLKSFSVEETGDYAISIIVDKRPEPEKKKRAIERQEELRKRLDKEGGE